MPQEKEMGSQKGHLKSAIVFVHWYMPVFLETVFLYSPECLELREPPASVSQVLG